MKKINGYSLLIIALLCFFLFCGDRGSNGTNPYISDATNTSDTTNTTDTINTRLSIIGDWVEEIPAMPPYIPGKLMVNLSILELGSSFTMSVVETDQANNDTLYKHIGIWQLGKSNFRGEDSLYLFGRESYIIDTTADPDTLIPLSKSIAEKKIALDTTGTGNDIWKIKLSSLTPFMSSMLPPLVVSFAYSMELKLERKKKVAIRY